MKFLLIFLFPLFGYAQETMHARYYSRVGLGGGSYAYVLLSDEQFGKAQLLFCDHFDALTAKEKVANDLQGCKSIFDKAGQMQAVTLANNILSFHQSGVLYAEARALGVSPFTEDNSASTKSWIAIFSVDTHDDAFMVLTGTAIQIKTGTPKSESVRVTFQKVLDKTFSNGELLLPVRRVE